MNVLRCEISTFKTRNNQSEHISHPYHPQSSHSPVQRGPVLRSDSRKDLAGAGETLYSPNQL